MACQYYFKIDDGMLHVAQFNTFEELSSYLKGIMQGMIANDNAPVAVDIRLFTQDGHATHIERQRQCV